MIYPHTSAMPLSSSCRWITTTLFFSLMIACGAFAASPKATNPAPWWPQGVAQAIANAGPNRAEILDALGRVPHSERDGMAFLIENMPAADLQTLSAPYLLDDVSLAYDAAHKSPWRRGIPQDLFLNDILPYACLNEARDGSRQMLRAKSEPLIAGCRTPGEAAQRLNEKLFPLLNVRYSTQRNRPDQAPRETIATGKATCSGLSILLVDACRSVGIPARVVGTPLWANNSGNHTWVEVWDGGWHFVGAAEPDPKGLDHAWFTSNAAQANRPSHAIYAGSFQRTGLAFPLVWAPEIDWVPAVDVTDRYASPAPAVPADTTRLTVKVMDADGKRVAAKVTVTDSGAGAVTFTGTSKDETADLNNVLSFRVPHAHQFTITVEYNGSRVRQEFSSRAEAQDLVVVHMDSPLAPISGGTGAEKSFLRAYSQPASRRSYCAVKPPKASVLTRLSAALTAYFTAPADRQAKWTFAPGLETLLLTDEPAVRQAAWNAYQAAPIHAAARKDFDAKQVTFDQYLSPYTLKYVGTRPVNSWPLFIAMHGGGGAPKEVNDEQWQEMQTYYKDHPEVGGYEYLALRAPNDTWNGFYDVYVYPLVANLVKQFLLFGNVDPNKVFLMGYSHGGYGALAIGPKEPDLFAAIHASAAAPTDGETTAVTLRHTVFGVMVGDQDTMYGRLERDQKFAAEVAKLRGSRTDIYPVTVSIMPGYHHSDLPDRDLIPSMYPSVRNPVPHDLTWLMTDDVITDFFWLHTDAPGKTQEIEAACQDNHVTVTTTPNVTSATVLLDSRLIDFAKPVTLEVNGKKTQQRVTPSLRTLCATLQRRGDPNLAFTAQLSLFPK